MFRKIGLVLTLMIVALLGMGTAAFAAAPVSQAGSLPANISTQTFNVSFTATDDHDLKRVYLYYSRYNGSSWPSYTSYGYQTVNGTSDSGTFSFDSSTTGGNGQYRFYTIARDENDNYESAPGSPGYDTSTTVNYVPPDTTKPSSNAIDNLPATIYSQSFNIDYSATDNVNLEKVTLYYSKYNGSTYPTPYTYYGEQTVSGTSASGTFSFNTATTGGNGQYRFYTRATDHATNVENAPSSPSYDTHTTVSVDSIKPSSSATCPATGISKTFTVSYSASDTGGSGLKNVILMGSYRSDGGSTWSDYTQYDGPKTSGSGSWTLTVSNWGQYRFYTIAEDNAGNVELMPATPPDCTITIASDTAAPVVNSLTAPSSPTTSTDLKINYDVSDTGGSQLDRLQIWYHYRHNEGGSWGNWTKYGDVTSIDGQDNATGHIHFTASDPGQYQFDCRVEDGAGNWNHGSNQEDFSVLAGITVNDNATACDLSSPDNGVWINTTTPTLTWGDVNRDFNYKEKYQIMVSDHSQSNPYDFDHRIIDVTQAAPGTSYTVAGGVLSDYSDNGNKPYYWAVLAIDDNDTALSGLTLSKKDYYKHSHVYSFKIDSKKPSSSLTAPTSPTSLAVFFIDYSATDTGGSGLEKLQVWYRYRTNKDGHWGDWAKYDGDINLPDNNSASGHVLFIAINGFGQYEFDSRVEDEAGNWNHGSNQGDFSVLASITVNAPAVACNLTSPGNGFSNPSDVWITTKTPKLIWESVNPTPTASKIGPVFNYREKYEVLISDGSAGPETNPYSFLNKTVDKPQLAPGNSYIVLAGDGLKDCDQNGNRPYYWSVLAIDDNDTPLPSLGRTFKSPAPIFSSNIFKFKIDSRKPTSSVNALTSPTNTTAISVAYTADDKGGSLLKEVELFVNKDGAGWNSAGVFPIATNPISYTASAGDGSYAFCTLAHDNAGNVEDKAKTAEATVVVDVTTPTSLAGPLPDITSTLTFDVPFISSDNGGSALKGVELFYRVNGGGWVSFGFFTTPSPISFSAPGDGTYDFRTVASDNAGNVEVKPEVAEATTLIDTTPPSSNVGGLPNITTSTSFDISYTSDDAFGGTALPAISKGGRSALPGGSGVADVQLWYRFRPNPAYSYGSWILYGTFTSSPILFDTALANGLGQYQFYTIAIDKAGNVEPPPAPGTADEEIFVTVVPAPIPPTPGSLNLNVRIGDNVANANAGGDLSDSSVVYINPVNGQIVFLGTTSGTNVTVKTPGGDVLGSSGVNSDNLYTVTVPLGNQLGRAYDYREGKNQFKIVATAPGATELALDRTVILDSTPPVLSDLASGGHNVLAGDFLAAGAIYQVKAVEINDGSGVDGNTFKCSLVSDGGSTFDVGPGTFTTGADNSTMLNFQLPGTLPNGIYSLKVEVADKVSPVNVGQLTLENLKVSQSIEVSGGVLPYPNPYNPGAGNITIAYNLSANADILVNIYSATGKKIFRAEFPAGSQGGSAGYNAIFWDGRNSAGELVGSGLYLIHIIDRTDGKLIGRGKIAVVNR